MSATVRHSTQADVEWLLTQLRAFAAFYGTSRSLFPENLEHARQSLSTLIEHHLLLIAERGGERLGFVAGLLVPHPFNPSIRTLIEQFFWVPEEHRKSRAAVLLLDAFTEIGESHADWVVFTLEHHSPMAERHLIKRGYRPQERQFLKEVHREVA